MRDFFRRLRDSFRNRSATRRTPRERARQRSGAEDAVRRGQVKQRTGFDAIVSDVAMDTGLRPKATEYYSRLNKRQERAQQEQARLRDRRRKRNDEKAEARAETTATPETEEVTNVTENTSTTALDPTTDTALTNVENISNQTFDNTDNISNYFDNTATSVNTAAAQEQNQASALTTSVGEAEDEAISYMTSGTGSNILTSAQGLLGGDDEDEDDPFNQRKTLIGA